MVAEDLLSRRSRVPSLRFGPGVAAMQFDPVDRLLQSPYSSPIVPGKAPGVTRGGASAYFCGLPGGVSLLKMSLFFAV